METSAKEESPRKVREGLPFDDAWWEMRSGSGVVEIQTNHPDYPVVHRIPFTGPCRPHLEAGERYADDLMAGRIPRWRENVPL